MHEKIQKLYEEINFIGYYTSKIMTFIILIKQKSYFHRFRSFQIGF